MATILGNPQANQTNNILVADLKALEESWTAFSTETEDTTYCWNNEDGDGDEAVIHDAWVQTLFPQQSSSPIESSSLLVNPRDWAEVGANYNFFYAAAAANDGGEHLSNDEWIVQRRRQERFLQIRQGQNDVSSELQVVFRSDHQRHDPSSSSILVEREVLLLSEEEEEEEEEEESAWRRERRRHRRWRARQLPVTVHAHRERIHHWSSSAIQFSLRILQFPLLLFVLIPNQMRSRRHREQQRDTAEIAREGLAHSPPPHTEWNMSGQGWRWGQDDDSRDGTHYWSTGTAIETDYGSLSGSSSADGDEQRADNMDINQNLLPGALFPL